MFKVLLPLTPACLAFGPLLLSMETAEGMGWTRLAGGLTLMVGCLVLFAVVAGQQNEIHSLRAALDRLEPPADDTAGDRTDRAAAR